MKNILTKIINELMVAGTKETGNLKVGDIILMVVKKSNIEEKYKILETPETTENNDYRVLRLSNNIEAEVNALWFCNSTRKSFLI